MQPRTPYSSRCGARTDETSRERRARNCAHDGEHDISQKLPIKARTIRRVPDDHLGDEQADQKADNRTDDPAQNDHRPKLCRGSAHGKFKRPRGAGA
jgi:hypothetical protein